MTIQMRFASLGPDSGWQRSKVVAPEFGDLFIPVPVSRRSDGQYYSHSFGNAQEIEASYRKVSLPDLHLPPERDSFHDFSHGYQGEGDDCGKGGEQHAAAGFIHQLVSYGDGE